MEHSEYTPSRDGGQNGNGVAAIAAKAEEKVRELSDSARQRAEQKVQKLGEKAQHGIDDQRERTASRLDNAASKLRERSGTAGPLKPAGEMVAVRMEKAAGYIHQHESKEIARDFARSIREHPLRTFLVAALVGYLLGRLTG